jgi:hypothetical protein
MLMVWCREQFAVRGIFFYFDEVWHVKSTQSGLFKIAICLHAQMPSDPG